MSVHEEVEEHVHHAREGFDKLVAGTMATIAAVLAVVSLLAQHYTNEKLLEQQKASDMWAYYQAKDIRRYTALTAQDLLKSANAPADTVQKYADDAARYKKQTQQEQEQAQEFEKQRDRLGELADAFDFGEVFLEIAIVLNSLAILMKRKSFYAAGVVSAIIGIAIAVVGWIRFSA